MVLLPGMVMVLVPGTRKVPVPRTRMVLVPQVYLERIGCSFNVFNRSVRLKG